MMIPVHSVALECSDYLPYLLSRVRYSLYQDLDAARIMQPLIPDSHVVPTPTGRHALWYFLALKDYPKGSEVLIAGYNYYVVVRLLVQMGLVPVFVDIEVDTLCIDPDDLEKKVTNKSVLILVTHMFGNPANMNRITGIAAEHSLHIFEDCAHSLGTHINGKYTGQFGDGALYSFGIAKIVNCFGGGMLILPNAEDRDYIVPEHQPGFIESSLDTFSRFLVSVISTPTLYQLTTFQIIKLANYLSGHGHVGLRNRISPSKNDGVWYFNPSNRAEFKPFMSKMLSNQIVRLENNIDKRRNIVSTLKSSLSKITNIAWLKEDSHGTANASYFGFYCDDKSSLSSHLLSCNIDNNPQEFFDCASLDQFSDFRQDCERSKIASEKIIRLPSYPTLSSTQVDYIAEAMTGFYLGEPMR